MHNEYRKAAKDAIQHIVDIAMSVMMTRDHYQMGGSFAKAIVDNDLYAAVSKADTECALALRYFVYCNKYVPTPKVS